MKSPIKTSDLDKQGPCSPIDPIGATLPVRFEFSHPTAKTVSIAGTFNNWDKEARPMQLLTKGRWMQEKTLAAGTYEYCLIVDGKFIADPLVKETVPNPFGGRNTLLKVFGAEQDH